MFQRTYSFTSIFKYMALIGDSLSSGEFQYEDTNNEGQFFYLDKIPYSWGQFLAWRNGAIMYNFTKGGMTAKEYNESFAKENDFYNPKYKAQAYLIALGVNDLLNLRFELGKLDDIDVNDYHNNKDTFMGQYAKIIQMYKEINPDAKFFLVSMPHDCRDSDNDKVMKKACHDFLHELCKIFSNCYVIDLYEKMEPYSFELNKKYFLNGHLNPMGYVYTANVIDNLIDEIIENNPKDFELVGTSDLIKTGL